MVIDGTGVTNRLSYLIFCRLTGIFTMHNMNYVHKYNYGSGYLNFPGVT